MRLRETLLTLAARLADLGYQTDAGAADLQQGNFKAWAGVCTESVAAGGSAQHLRALLKGLSEKTWNYVAWLTHARAAGRPGRTILTVVAIRGRTSATRGCRQLKEGRPDGVRQQDPGL
jgi:hypothetical protein